MIRVSRQHKEFRGGWWVAVWCLLLLSWPVSAQEFENLDGSGGNGDSTYRVKLNLEYLENERATEETGYYDVYQKNTLKEARGRLDYHFLHLDGFYKENDAIVKIGADESRLSMVRDSTGTWVEFLEYFYLFGQRRHYRTDYRFINNAIPSFGEDEGAVSTNQGLGVVFGDWRFGLSFGADFDWSYRVEVLDQVLISERIEFAVSVMELVKQATEKQGPYYELGLKSWRSQSTKDNRDGDLERSEGYLLLGMGFSERALVYLGQNLSIGRIKSRLEAGGSSLQRRSIYENSVIGTQFEVGESGVIYLQRDFSSRRIDLENVAFESNNRFEEEKYTIGTALNEQLSLELKIGRTVNEKAYAERVVTAQSYRYRQSDYLVGISINLHFFD